MLSSSPVFRKVLTRFSRLTEALVKVACLASRKNELFLLYFYSVIFMYPVATLAETATYAIHILSCQKCTFARPRILFSRPHHIIYHQRFLYFYVQDNHKQLSSVVGG